MNEQISRRSFLKGAAALGAVGASTAMGLLTACSTNDTTTTSPPLTAQPTAVPVAEQPALSPLTGMDHTYGSMLNPQSDFTADSGDYSALFSPLKIGGITLKNRIVKSCAGSEMQKSAEWPDDASLYYYEQFCKGGVGMVCYESSNVLPGPGMFGGMPGGMPGVPTDDSMGGLPSPDMAQLDISTDEGIPAHKAIADYMHQYDVPVIAQVLDMMMTGGGGGSYSEDDKLETSMNPGRIQPTEEVHAQQKHFIDAAVRYYKAGFDGIEINCSCNHYFSTFLSRFCNHERTDQYSGATVENRSRIVTEIIEGIRREVGNDFIIQVLYSGIEENVARLGDNSLCITIEEACEMARLFEKAGASSLHIRSQAYGHHCGGFMPDVFHQFEHGDTGYNSVIDYNKHFGGIVNGQYDGFGALIEVTSHIKSIVSIPVGAVGSMDPRVAPDLFNKAIADGKIDFLLMTRILMADPAIANKLKEGKRDEIAPCTHCMTCFVAPFGMGLPMYCRVNPAITRAYTEDMPEGYDPVPANEKKKVMVIGGGPAGMEAARIAAQRGYNVALYEKNDKLGGLLDFTQTIKGPHERINDYRKYLERQLQVYNVQVNLNREVDLALVKTEAPDTVIVAVGGLMNTLNIPVADTNSVLSFDDIRGMIESQSELSVGDNIVIIGGQFQACETAAHLARLGKNIIMLNPGPESELYMNSAVWVNLMGKSWLYGKGVKIYHEAKLNEITRSGVVFETNYATTMTVPYDSVIQALPLVTNRELYDSILGICDDVYAVGDCYSPNTIANATARANIIARRIGSSNTGTAQQLAPNQYSATASGYGEVKVTITVDNDKITEVVVNTADESAGIGRELGAQFEQQILAGGSIDAVSGATMTSNAVKSALEECLVKAGLK